jgi:predicted aldo/keto reductase-like oxidoreductase
LELRILGRTGLQVSVLGFGGISIQSISPKEAEQLLLQAVKLGINFFDTARAYTDSERKMKCLAGLGSRVILATKSLARDADGLRRDLEASLEELGREKVDLYQLHNVSKKEELERVLARGGALEGARKAQEEGLVGFVGISSHNADTALEALRTGEFDTLQVPVNVVESHYEEKGVLREAGRRRVGVIAMKPMGGGAIHPAPAALRYALSREVATVIPGMRTLRELEENVAALEERLFPDDREMEALRRLADSLGDRFCRRCQYCLPCPEGIYIPQVFICLATWRWRGEPERAVELYRRSVPVPASACSGCGSCEEKCPYNLPVRDMLSEAVALLEWKGWPPATGVETGEAMIPTSELKPTPRNKS